MSDIPLSSDYSVLGKLLKLGTLDLVDPSPSWEVLMVEDLDLSKLEPVIYEHKDIARRRPDGTPIPPSKGVKDLYL